MRDWKKPALIAAGVGVVALVLLRKSDDEKVQAPRDIDLDALANMLITETGFRKSREEMAQIVFVALNRANKWRTSIANVVSPYSTAKTVWNDAEPYRDRFLAAKSNPRWGEARAFADAVINGRSGYRNLGATLFLHPGGMSKPPCGKNRVSVDTGSYYGVRCLPEWSARATSVGTARFS
jgi:hypothetical protein